MSDRDGKYVPCSRIRVNGKKERASHLAMQQRGHVISQNEVVHHIDQNPQNNNPDNLEIMTRSKHSSLHNPRDRSRYGVSAAENKQFWMKHYNREKGVGIIKVTEEIYKQIKVLLGKGIKQAEIGKRFSIHQSTVSHINTGKGYNTGYGWLVNKRSAM